MQENLLVARAQPRTLLGGAYSTPPDTLASGEGLIAPLQDPILAVGHLGLGLQPFGCR